MFAQRLLSWFRRTPPQPSTTVPPDSLEPIREAHFPHAHPARFYQLWCEIADILGVDALALGPEDVIIELCPNSKYPVFNDRLHTLEGLIMTESRKCAPPPERMHTVRDVVAYLLSCKPEPEGPAA